RHDQAGTMPPDSSSTNRPASAANANTIQRISSGLRYFLNLSYQAMAVSFWTNDLPQTPGGQPPPGRLCAHLHLGKDQQAHRIAAHDRVDRCRRNVALLEHRQEVAKHSGVAVAAMA